MRVAIVFAWRRKLAMVYRSSVMATQPQIYEQCSTTRNLIAANKSGSCIFPFDVVCAFLKLPRQSSTNRCEIMLSYSTARTSLASTCTTAAISPKFSTFSTSVFEDVKNAHRAKAPYCDNAGGPV